ncbi:hypothetical protein AAG565_03945 [Fontimonas sp. SYSU GA230001]|uniref:hypothetical protein n=1 Tax=Fontimonas sp. SYSU GA230001 TaxID=3142450 RepID=UPI0032B3765C
MAWLELALILGAAAALTLAARRVRAFERAVEQDAAQLRRDAALLIEARRLREMQNRLAGAQRLAETAIDTGTATVRAVHRGISRIPFGILEAIPVTRDATRIVRQTHDLISDAVYGTIRGVNKAAGEVTRTVIGTPSRRKPDASPDAS